MWEFGNLKLSIAIMAKVTVIEVRTRGDLHHPSFSFFVIFVIFHHLSIWTQPVVCVCTCARVLAPAPAAAASAATAPADDAAEAKRQLTWYI